MNIRFTCLPGHEAFLPKPVPAGRHLPQWLKSMPASAHSAVLDGAAVRTVKQCPPFIDAMRDGFLFPLATDLHVAGGEFSWDWNLPIHPLARTTRSPIGVHVPEQANGLPGAIDDHFIVKFNNFWTVCLPEGWSLLFSHPHNRMDLPFRTFSGMVDCDQWSDGFVHFPAVWTDPEFEGTLVAGTPVAQAFPVRRDRLELGFDEMDEEALQRHLRIQDELQEEPGLYRKKFQAPRG